MVRRGGCPATPRAPLAARLRPTQNSTLRCRFVALRHYEAQTRCHDRRCGTKGTVTSRMRKVKRGIVRDRTRRIHYPGLSEGAFGGTLSTAPETFPCLGQAAGDVG